MNHATYRGYTIFRLDIGAWVVPFIHGRPFATLERAKTGIDILLRHDN